jgi:hypothetical protein
MAHPSWRRGHDVTLVTKPKSDRVPRVTSSLPSFLSYPDGQWRQKTSVYVIFVLHTHAELSQPFHLLPTLRLVLLQAYLRSSLFIPSVRCLTRPNRSENSLNRCRCRAWDLASNPVLF